MLNGKLPPTNRSRRNLELRSVLPDLGIEVSVDGTPIARLERERQSRAGRLALLPVRSRSHWSTDFDEPRPAASGGWKYSGATRSRGFTRANVPTASALIASHNLADSWCTDFCGRGARRVRIRCRIAMDDARANGG